MSRRDGSFKWIPAGAGMTEGSWKLEAGIPMFPDVKPGLRSIPEVLRDKLRLKRLEAGRNKVSLRDGSFKWIPAGAGMTEGVGDSYDKDMPMRAWAWHPAHASVGQAATGEDRQKLSTRIRMG